MNKPRETKNLLVALDIGTSKIVAIVAEVNDEGSVEVLGIGQHPSKGLKKGVVCSFMFPVFCWRHITFHTALHFNLLATEVRTANPF